MENVALDDWEKRKFQGIAIIFKHFFSTIFLEKNISNKKVSSAGGKFSEEFQISYKYTNNDDFQNNPNNILKLVLLYPNRNCITPAKKKVFFEFVTFCTPNKSFIPS